MLQATGGFHGIRMVVPGRPARLRGRHAPGRIGQRVALVDPDLDRAAAIDVEQRRGRRFQVLALGDVGEQRRPRRDRASPSGPACADAERRDRSGRLAEADEHAERPQAVERARETCPCRRNRRRRRSSLPPVISFTAATKSCVAVVDHMVVAMRLGEFHLVGRTGGADRRSRRDASPTGRRSGRRRRRRRGRESCRRASP